MKHCHPFTNRSFQPRPKVAAKKHSLGLLTRPNRAKLLQPRKINVGPPAEANQQNWAATLGKAKDASGATTSLASVQPQPANVHTIHAIFHFTQSSYKIYRTFEILCEMYPTGKNMPK